MANPQAEEKYIDGGFIVLARKLEENGSTFSFCKNDNQRWLFIKCLLRANFQDVVINGIELVRGQFITGIDKFAKEAHSTPKKVRGFWQKFSKLGFLALKKTNKYTIVTILNYDKYQSIENYFREKGHAKRQSRGKQRATDKEYIKKDKEKSPLPYIQKIIEVYKEMRGYINQPDWDKYHYKRHVAPAKRLYEVAGDDWQGAMEWVSKQGYCEWTLETIIKKFPDYKKARDQKPLGAAGRILNEQPERS